MGDYILYEGDVAAGDADQLAGLILRTGINVVHMDSPGGDAVEGYRLGYTIQGLGASVVVADGAACLSACATAFLGGRNKTLDGFIGFHVAWTEATGTRSEGMKDGQYIAAINAFYNYDMGYIAQLQFIVAQLTDKDNFLVFEDMEDLDLFKMVSGEYTSFIELPPGWLADHVAGPTRLSLLSEGL